MRRPTWDSRSGWSGRFTVSDKRLLVLIRHYEEPVIQRDRIEGEILACLRELQTHRASSPLEAAIASLGKCSVCRGTGKCVAGPGVCICGDGSAAGELRYLHDTGARQAIALHGAALGSAEEMRERAARIAMQVYNAYNVRPQDDYQQGAAAAADEIERGIRALSTNQEKPK